MKCFNPLLVGSTFHTLVHKELEKVSGKLFQSPISRVYFSHAYSGSPESVRASGSRFNPLLVGSTFHTAKSFLYI